MQPVFGFGDFNVPAEALRASGILEGLGLEIIAPSNGEATCLAGKGSVIDYVVGTKGFKDLVFSCEVVRSVPCATHIGARTTFVPDASDVFITSLRQPRSLKAAVAHFESHNLFEVGYAIPVFGTQHMAAHARG